MGGEFIPKLDEGDYAIEVRLPVGSSLNASKEFADKAQKILMQKFPDEIVHIVAKIGTSEIPTDPMPMEAMDLIITLNQDKQQWKKAKTKDELTKLITKELEKFPGIVISVSQPIDSRFNDMLSGAKTDVVVKVFGDDLDKLISIGNQIVALINTLQGSADVQIQKVKGLPQIIIKYDRKLLSYYGIKIDDVNKIIQTGFAGSKAGTIYDGEKRFDLTVRLSTEDRNGIEDLLNLQVSASNGSLIPLREVADIKFEKGPTEISRENGQRKLNVGFNVRGRDVESIVNELQLKIKDNIKLPDGYSLEYGGAFENLQRAKARLVIVIPISLLIIFGLLYATFGNISDSLIVYSGIPLSAVGGIFALVLRDMAFSISAGIGFISLFGIAVLNGILLIGHFKTIENRPMSGNVYDIVKTGVVERFRQVLMTSATAALGFLPMAISTGTGAEIQKPLATVVIGGLFTATILTLVVLPVLYIVVNQKRIEKKLNNSFLEQN
jgi:cobalt-zinc-cadmium resistance protein CzcA